MKEKTRQDVLETVNYLIRDLEENPDSWENITLADYIEAMGRWFEDWCNKYDPKEASWDLMVGLVMSGKIYE